jgi:hypothetical protein
MSKFLFLGLATLLIIGCSPQNSNTGMPAGHSPGMIMSPTPSNSPKP